MKIFRHVVFALLIVGPMLLSNFSQAEAALWHSPSGQWWTVAPVCRIGVNVTMILPNYGNDTVMSMSFEAYDTKISSPPVKIQKKDGVYLGKNWFIGAQSVTAYYHDDPYHWKNHENGEQGTAHVYGSANLYWKNGKKLPKGLIVHIRSTGHDGYFRGVVTDCWLPKL